MRIFLLRLTARYPLPGIYFSNVEDGVDFKCRGMSNLGDDGGKTAQDANVESGASRQGTLAHTSRKGRGREMGREMGGLLIL